MANSTQQVIPKDNDKSNVDCKKGREMGCHTFCCRLLVRLDPDERYETDDNGRVKGYMDKTKEGLCIHYDTNSHLCSIWENRPRVCREYECNSDFLLQIVLRSGFKSIGATAKEALNTYIRKEDHVYVPLIKS